MDNGNLINTLAQMYEDSKMSMDGSAYKSMLEKEYIKALDGTFDVEKIYITSDGRYKTRTPIQVCRKNKVDVLKAIYEYYFGMRDNPTVEYLYQEWLKEFKELVVDGHKSWDTYDRYISDWNGFIANADISKMPISKIKMSDLKKYYQKLTAHEAMTRKRLSNIKTIMNHVFRYAMDNDIITVNLAENVNTRDLICKEVDNEDKVYSSEERDRIIKTALMQSGSYENAIVLMFCLCARIGEIKALKWSDVDFDKRLINIHSSMRRTRNSEGKQVYVWTNTTKGRKKSGQRVEPLSDTACRVLKRQLLQNADGEYIFMDRGHGLDTTQFNRVLKRICNKCGVEYLSSHKIRFTSVTTMIDYGVSLGKVQRIAGHSRASTTEDYVRNRKTAIVGLDTWNQMFN